MHNQIRTGETGQTLYPAIIRRTGGLFDISFVDVPSCCASGSSREESCRNAEDALSFSMWLTSQQGGLVPQPSKLSETLPDGAEMIFVPLRSGGSKVRFI